MGWSFNKVHALLHARHFSRSWADSGISDRLAFKCEECNALVPLRCSAGPRMRPEGSPSVPMASGGGTAMPGPPLSRARPHFQSQHPTGSSPAPPIAAAMLSPGPLQKPALTLPPGISVGSQGAPQPHLHLPGGGVRPGGAMNKQGAPQLAPGISPAPGFAGLASMNAQGPGALTQRPTGPGGMDRMPLLVHGLAGATGATGMAPGVAPAIMGAGGVLTMPQGLGLQEGRGLAPVKEGGMPGARWQETMLLRMKSLWAVVQTACREMAAAHFHRLEQLRASDEAEKEAVGEALQRYLQTAEVLSAIFGSDALSLTLLPGKAPESTQARELLISGPGEQEDDGSGCPVQALGMASGGSAEPPKAAQSTRRRGAGKEGTRRSPTADAAGGAAVAPQKEHKEEEAEVELTEDLGTKQKRAKVADDAGPTGRISSALSSVEGEMSKHPQGAADAQGPCGVAALGKEAVPAQSSKRPGREAEGGLEDILEAAAYAMLQCGWTTGRPGWSLQGEAPTAETPEGKGPGRQEAPRKAGATPTATGSATPNAASVPTGAGTDRALNAGMMGAEDGKGVAGKPWSSRVLARIDELADRLSRKEMTDPGAPEHGPWDVEHQGSMGKGVPGGPPAGARGAAKPPELPRASRAVGSMVPRSHLGCASSRRPGCVSRWSPNRPLLGALEGQPWHLGVVVAAKDAIAAEAMGVERQGEEGPGARVGFGGDKDETLSPFGSTVLRVLAQKASWADVASRQVEVDREVAQYIDARNCS